MTFIELACAVLVLGGAFALFSLGILIWRDILRG